MQSCNRSRSCGQVMCPQVGRAKRRVPHRGERGLGGLGWVGVGIEGPRDHYSLFPGRVGWRGRRRPTRAQEACRRLNGRAGARLSSWFGEYALEHRGLDQTKPHRIGAPPKIGGVRKKESNPCDGCASGLAVPSVERASAPAPEVPELCRHRKGCSPESGSLAASRRSVSTVLEQVLVINLACDL